ncbi:MAG: hypothetical protein QOH04_1785 [Sphingomonadales bacterium]|jgi:hypothetical protein|nr:hypothetical protein [Sphingomonadales bacterium]MEA3036020.1 hypothetical protein [Sphingomonadales bacterium]
MSASEALQAGMVAALRAASGLAVYDAPPVQAVFPYALVECGPETDWGHKSGKGRELRVAVTVRDGGERPVRLLALMNAIEAALEAPPVAEGWQIVTFAWLRSRSVREGRAPGPVEWTGVAEYRARILASA